MRSALKTRIKNLVNAIPAKDLYEMTELIYDYLDKRGFKILEDFSMGDEVSFMKNRKKIDGTISKINKNTASVVVPPDYEFDVPAYLLRKEQYLKGK